jgi:hypothetical protein
MPDCCDSKDYESVFSGRFARRVARRYNKHGLTPAATRIVTFVTEHDVQGASVLEIGGGVGELQVELLRRGASGVTNLEISTSYEEQAARLLESSGMTGRVDRRLLVFSHPADNVVTKALFGGENLLRWVRRNGFRAFIHPPEAMIAVAEGEGMTTTYRHHAWDWDVVGLAR